MFIALFITLATQSSACSNSELDACIRDCKKKLKEEVAASCNNDEHCIKASPARPETCRPLCKGRERAGNVKPALQQACDDGNHQACASVASKLIEGQPDDQRRAAKLNESACAHDIASACFGLSTAYFLGRGAPLNKMKAKALAEKACKLGSNEGCRLAEL